MAGAISSGFPFAASYLIDPAPVIARRAFLELDKSMVTLDGEASGDMGNGLQAHSPASSPNTVVVERTLEGEIAYAYSEAGLGGVVEPRAEKTVTIAESLRILSHTRFYVLAGAYFFGVGMGVMVLTSSTNLVFEVTGGGPEQSASVLPMFSIMTALFNFISGFSPLSPQLTTAVSLLYALAVCVVVVVLGSALGAAVVSALLGSMGATFGVILAELPGIIGNVYGEENFGVFYSYFGGVTTVATVFTPFLGNFLPAHSTMLFFGAGCAVFAALLQVPLPDWTPLYKAA